MTQNRAPKAAPVGWVFIDRHRPEGFTIRWRRGDPIAYVLSGRRVGEHGTAHVLGTIAVLPAGWTDLAEIRALGHKWMTGAVKSAPPPGKIF